MASREIFRPARRPLAYVLAARMASELITEKALDHRGRRECRARNAPAASGANEKSTRVSHHGHTGTTRHSPRNGFTAYSALSSVTTLFDTVACASYRRLDANDWGRRNHTTSPYASRPRSSRALPASTASRPAFVTCARPSIGTGPNRYSADLPRRQAKFLKFRNWQITQHQGPVENCPIAVPGCTAQIGRDRNSPYSAAICRGAGGGLARSAANCA